MKDTTRDSSPLLCGLTFNFEKGKVNTTLSVDKLLQVNTILPPFIDLFPMLVPSTEREEIYRRTTFHMVDKRFFRTTFLQFLVLWVSLNKREK